MRGHNQTESHRMLMMIKSQCFQLKAEVFPFITTLITLLNNDADYYPFSIIICSKYIHCTMYYSQSAKGGWQLLMV